MAKAGSVEIEITALTGKFRSGIEKANKGLKSLTDRLKDTKLSARGMATALASIGAGGFVAKRIFDIGAAVEETASKFATVFGPEAEKVEAQLANIARLSGLSAEQMQELSATSGQVVRGMGFSREAAADFAVEIQKLAGDLGSFNNIPVAETSRAIQAALTGEREQLKRLGIVVREVDVQQRAMTISGAANARQITNQARAAATMQIIAERAGSAVGDLARTQDSAAAQARILQSDLINLRDQIADALMPTLVQGLRVFHGFVQGMRLWAGQLKISKAVVSDFLANTILPFIVGQEKAAEAQATAAAEVNSASVAFMELEQEMIDAINSTNSFNGSASNLSTVLSEAVSPMSMMTERTVGLNKRLTEHGVTVVPRVVAVTSLYADSLERAADEQDRLNSVTSKFGAVSSALGFIGRFAAPIAGIASGFGAITTGLGIGQTLLNTFSGGNQQQARLDTNLTISINGISDGTTQVIRGKLSDFDKRDVPVVI